MRQCYAGLRQGYSITLKLALTDDSGWDAEHATSVDWPLLADCCTVDAVPLTGRGAHPTSVGGQECPSYFC